VNNLVLGLTTFLVGALLFSACGYHNPYVYTGPTKSIYVTTWSNRTSELLLDAKIYQALLRWYQKSGSLRVTKTKEGADYILAGEVISIDRPSLTFRGTNTTTQVNLRLRVRYVLKDLVSDEIVVEQPSEEWIEPYRVGADSTRTRDNEDEALETIIDELSQSIYQRSLLEFSQR
jgi:hypothetical protein